MSTQVITSDLFVPLSADEQQLLSGGQSGFGGRTDEDGWRRRYFRLRRCVRRCLRF